MIEKLSIGEIAYKEGYDVVSTTSEMTGYPKNVGLAITGFSSFGEAKNLADKYDKTVTLLTRHDGWNIWYNSSKELLEAPHLEAADIGYCQEITNADYEGDLIDSLRCTIDGLGSLDAIACAAGFYANIYDMAQKLDENETIYFNRDGGELWASGDFIYQHVFRYFA